MGVISLLWGIVAVLWMLLAFIPLLGWGNWFMIPFAAIGVVLSAIAIAVTRREHRGRAKTALVLNVLAVAFGIVRLTLGGGIV